MPGLPDTIRPESHRLDIEELAAAGQDALAAELSAPPPSTPPRPRRLERLTAAGGGLLAALGAARELDLLGHPRDPAAAGHRRAASLLQVQTGVASHRRRFGGWHGGFWLPECAHAPWLDELLEDAGVRATCVELTGVFGLGDAAPPAPAGGHRRPGAVAA